jgi:hypothetical protein
LLYGQCEGEPLPDEVIAMAQTLVTAHREGRLGHYLVGSHTPKQKDVGS